MNGNICPKCRKPVMPYRRFLKEAEPFKVSPCGSCGEKLKRSPRVFVYLLVMLAILAGASIPLFIAMAELHYSTITIWSLAILWLATWVILINYLSWRFIGWVVAEQKDINA